MKTCLTILIFLILTNSYGQERYYDRFDMNLKGKTTYVKEVSVFSLADLTSPEYDFLDSSLYSLLRINEYYFDSAGWIKREIHHDFTGDSDTATDTLLKHETRFYKDSVVTQSYLRGKQLVFTEVKLLDSEGYLERIKIQGVMGGSIIYKRNANHQIVTILEDLQGIDTRTKKKTTLLRNGKSDVILEKSELELFYALDDNIDKIVTLEKYRYIYNSDKNWIVKTTFVNDTLTLITQRIIRI